MEEFQVRRILVPRDGRGGHARDVNRDAQFAGNDLDAGNMIGMLVGNENRGEGFGGFPDGAETLESFFAGEACVD